MLSKCCCGVLQLSMDRVQVFPDGELNVQAVTTAGTSAAFARPVTKGGQQVTQQQVSSEQRGQKAAANLGTWPPGGYWHCHRLCWSNLSVIRCCVQHSVAAWHKHGRQQQVIHLLYQCRSGCCISGQPGGKSLLRLTKSITHTRKSSSSSWQWCWLLQS